MGRKRRRVFTVQTALGYRVVLERDRWRQIVQRKHPALAGRERDVRACLESPALVRESATDPDVHMYYKAAGTFHLCVVTAPSTADEHFVVTAYLTRKIKQGKVLWKS